MKRKSIQNKISSMLSCSPYFFCNKKLSNLVRFIKYFRRSGHLFKNFLKRLSQIRQPFYYKQIRWASIQYAIRLSWTDYRVSDIFLLSLVGSRWSGVYFHQNKTSDQILIRKEPQFLNSRKNFVPSPFYTSFFILGGLRSCPTLIRNQPQCH